MLLSLLEVAKRGMTGLKVADKEWNMGLFRKLQELEKRYNFETFKNFVSSDVRAWRNRILDEAEIEDYFQAGIDFLVEKGVFCIDTHRVIQFSEQEIRDGIRMMPEHVTIGEGKDTRQVRKRRWNGDRGYRLVCGGLHHPIRVDLTPYIPMIFARIPRVDFLEGFTFRELDGYEIFGPAIEAHAAKREAAWMREGLRKAGRPGMSIVYYPILTRASTMIAPLDPEYGIRRCDGALLAMLPGLMCNYDYITASIVYEQYGLAHKRQSGGGGGQFAAGPTSKLIARVASTIAGWMVYRDNLGSGHAQIFDKKTNMIRVGGYANMSGCLGVNGMLRMANTCIRHIASGASAVVAGGAGRVESLTPTEVELVCEVVDATSKAGLKVEDATHIVEEIEAKHGVREFFEKINSYTDGFGITGWDGKNYGFGTLRTNYDLVKMQPSEEHYKDYIEAKKILTDYGLNMI
jgi:methylamine--corrinoid protein Co-methyltransferase